MRGLRRWMTWGLCLLIVWPTAASTAAGPDKVGPRGACGPPPPPVRQRHASAEGKPPGGGVSKLPCAPTRRTEKKSPPAPPTLVAKLSFGDNLDWQTDRNDMFNLLKIVQYRMNVHYRPTVTNFKAFSFDPMEVPVLYFTGHNPWRLANHQRAKMRRFLYGGGTFILDSCCGSEPFYKSARHEVRRVLPKSSLRRLPADHPVFWAYYTVDKVKYGPTTKGAPPDGTPYLEGMDIGCRTALFVSKYDLSCGWDNHTHPQGSRILLDDAVHLGVNMLAYSVAGLEQERSLASSRAYVSEDQHTRGKVMLAQLALPDEDPDRHPAATSNLLAHLSAKMRATVLFKRQVVPIKMPELQAHPLVFLSGHHSFTLSESQVLALRQYLERGGFVLGEACCGRMAFDQSFRRAIARVFPNQGLRTLPADDPLYRIPHKIEQVQFSRALAARMRAGAAVSLEGIQVRGAWTVVYSKYGLSCGWQEGNCPYSLSYAPEDSLRLGVNVLTYALSH